jgi:hypothetical protein
MYRHGLAPSNGAASPFLHNPEKPLIPAPFPRRVRPEYTTGVWLGTQRSVRRPVDPKLTGH